MVKYAVIFLVCVVSFNAVAQLDPQKMQSLRKIEKYRRMRNLGLVMVIAGTTMGVVGFTRIINTPSTQTVADQDVILYMAGAPFFSAGIPLSVIGHNTMRKYEKRLEENTRVSLNLIVAPRRQGILITLKF